MLRRTFFLASVLAVLSTSGCGDGSSSTTDAAVRMDAAASDVGTADGSAVDAASTEDAAIGDAASADAGTDANTGAIDAGGPALCASLPACEASKGCGPMLTTRCCCGDSVFDPTTASNCCCGYGIVPGAFLMCEG